MNEKELIIKEIEKEVQENLLKKIGEKEELILKRKNKIIEEQKIIIKKELEKRFKNKIIEEQKIILENKFKEEIKTAEAYIENLKRMIKDIKEA